MPNLEIKISQGQVPDLLFPHLAEKYYSFSGSDSFLGFVQTF